MFLMHDSSHKKPLLLIAVLLLLIGISSFAMNMMNTSEPDNTDLTNVPREVTLEGQFTCLPHKDTSGPVTMECAFGLKADDGNHYALDMSDVSSDPSFAWDMQGRVTIQGLLVPLMMISSDQWSKYDIVGVISVTAVTEESSS